MKQKILVVVAHPDDEVVGCAGTAARLAREGCQVYTLILGEGITSRDEKPDRKKRKKELENLKKQAKEANKILGVKEVFLYDLPDNRFDTVCLLDIVKIVESIKNKIRPDIIFTHSERDLNVDHQITYKAVITSTRPLQQETVKEIYSFEVLSSTEWNYPLSFSPDIFFDIWDTLKYKLEALGIYKSELRVFPHPRSLEAIKLNAEYRGMQVGLKHAEAFKTVRIIR